MNGTKGLGRGLDALFAGSPQEEEKNTSSLTSLPITVLVPNPHQPRRHFDDVALRELADSIQKQGIIQPLLVRPINDQGGYQIVAGERRWRAATLAGLTHVPVYIRSLSDREVLAAALIENLQREDLNPIEEAEALQSLRDALELTQEELAERLGKSRPAIANALRLLQLSPEARADLQAGKLSAGHCRCLLGISDALASETLRTRILSHRLTVRETEDAVIYWKENNQFPWQTSSVQPLKENKKNSRKKPAHFKKIQQNLTETMGCTARINGDEEKGRIVLAYTCRDEFTTVLNKLGISLDDEQETTV